MTRKPINEQEAIERLNRALETPADDLTHEQAEALLPALIEAERAGEDVDSSPRFAALLSHLEQCDDCLDLYEQMAEDMEALVGEAETLPTVALEPPTFFAPVRQSEKFALRLLQQVKRGFEFTFQLPALGPAAATLGKGTRESLFADNVREVEGAPHVSVAIGGSDEAAELGIAVRDLVHQGRWRIELTVGEQTFSAITDEHGIARFKDLKVAGLDDIILRCVELPAQTDA